MIGLGLLLWQRWRGGTATGPGAGSKLLLESGSYLLLETGDKLLLE